MKTGRGARGRCNRTDREATAHAILMRVLATCRQRGMTILEYLIQLGMVQPVRE